MEETTEMTGTIDPTPVASMPEPLQTGFLYFTSAALALFVIWAAYRCVKEQTLVPILFFAAGFCTIIMEPMVTFLGHAIHPQVGQISHFETINRPIPWHITLTYTWYFGGVYLLLYNHMKNRTLNSGMVWKIYWGTCIFAYVIEIIPVSFGLWIYYEPQALWVWKGGMPLFWTFVNSACIMGGALACYLLFDQFKGVKQLLAFPVAFVAPIMVHLGAGSVYYNAANSHLGDGMVQLAGLASVGLALMMMWAGGVLVNRVR